MSAARRVCPTNDSSITVVPCIILPLGGPVGAAKIPDPAVSSPTWFESGCRSRERPRWNGRDKRRNGSADNRTTGWEENRPGAIETRPVLFAPETVDGRRSPISNCFATMSPMPRRSRAPIRKLHGSVGASEMGDDFMDVDPRVGQARMARMGIADEYYTAIAPDPTEEELVAIRQQLRRLCGRPES
jgi:hypothetical protein